MATRKKTPVPKFYGKMVQQKDGNLVPVLKNRHYYQDYVNNAFRPEQDISIVIKRNYRRRTTGNKEAGDKGNQNGYLYAVVLPMVSEATGYTIDQACDALETMLCQTGLNEYGMPKILRFKEMTTVEFNEYVIDAENPNSVRSWALETLEIDIPEPEKEVGNKGYTADTGDSEEDREN